MKLPPSRSGIKKEIHVRKDEDTNLLRERTVSGEVQGDERKRTTDEVAKH